MPVASRVVVQFGARTVEYEGRIVYDFDPARNVVALWFPAGGKYTEGDGWLAVPLKTRLLVGLNFLVMVEEAR